MINAPQAAIILIETPGDRGVWRKSQQARRQHKAVRPIERWRERQDIPEPNHEALRRAVERMREAHRPQAEALIAQGRTMLSALRAAA
jgi:hypothetical protein